jgi:uncharacterized protein YjdB/peptidoglycan/xylan/chitin deacetylase (PgdA/CDA1 family)/lysophospholipase L1-like esterase
MKTTLKLFNLIWLMLLCSMLNAQTVINASDQNIQYTGRINNTDPNNVVFAYPGISIKAKFQGTAIDAILVEGGSGTATTTNYFNVIIDGGTPTVLKLSAAQTIYNLATGLTDATHTVELFKRTETSVGKVTFKGFQVNTGKTLVTPDPLPTRKIMFIGNSITCGYGNELTTTTPDSYHFTSANENNYKAWGAVTARNLNAQYHCVAYSGRGLYRNNSGTTTGTAPNFFDQTIADDASSTWDHSKYIPDVLVINLGTNDFAAEASNAALYTVDKTTFTTTYSNFITKIRSVYPNTKIFLCVGVMMNDYYPVGTNPWTRIQDYVSTVVTAKNTAGDANIFYYMMDPQLSPYGEDWHPTAAEDVIMATGLTSFINSKVTWTSCPGTVNLGSDINVNTATFPLTLNSNSVARTGVTYKWYKDGTVISGATSSTYQISSSTGAAAIYKVERDSATCILQDQVELNTVLVPVGQVAKWDYNKKAAVVLTFDDWSAGHPAIVVPELKLRNLNATFSIVPSIVSDWNPIKSAAIDGNEMANHTRTHIYCNTPALYASDGTAAKTTIESNVTTQKVSTFIYPFGSYDASLIGYLEKDGYVGARGVYPSSGNYSYNFAPTIDDYYKVLTFSMDATITTSAFTTQIQNIIAGGGMLTYLYHSVNSPTVVDNNYATLPQSALQAQLDALVSYKSSVWITTFSNALKYHREARCATLGEVQAPNGVQWVVKLTDTLSNNSLYNQPLYVQLKMNGVKYDQVTQNGIPLTIDYSANDSIMFHAVPDGGNIILKTSSGIALTALVSPSQISNTSTTIKFTAIATPTSPNTISQVTLNLTAIGGGSAVAMTALGNNTYEYNFTVASGLSLGDKSIDITATDNAVHSQTATVVVTVGSGITIVSSSVSPSTVINNIANPLTFTLNATDDGSVASVKLDLSSIGGGTAVAMTSVGSNNYTASYILPTNAATGTKTIIATVTDNVGNTKQTTISLTINASISYLDIYTDASTMISGSWAGGTTDVIAEQSNAGAIEGVKDYKFSYTIVSYWAGMGMSLTNFNDALAKDFSGYDSLQFSYKGPITSGIGINLSLIGLANAKSTSVSLPASSTYTTVTIGLKQFGTFDLTKITQLAIDITGAAAGAGTLQFDNIRLSKAVVVTNIPVSAITFTPAAATTMTIGGTQTISAVATPTNATDKSVLWSTSDATIASVSTSGIVTAIKAGTVTITATSNSTSTIKQSVTIAIANILPSSIAITPTGAQSVTAGSSLSLTATIAPTNAFNKTVTWTSSDANIASVDGTGKVTGIKAGSVTITATSNAVSSVIATTSVLVSNILVSGIVVIPTSKTLLIGQTTQITASVSPSNATLKTYTWASSNASIVSVDANGNINAIALGSATISATANDASGISGTCIITVNPILPISIAANDIAMPVTETAGKTISYSFTPTTTTDKSVTFVSANPSIATVDANGLVLPISAGTTTVTITSSTLSSITKIVTITITSTIIDITGVTVDIPTLTLSLGKTQTITPTVTPANASGTTITWSSSDATIASVDANGIITAVKPGNATITVTVTAGSFTKTATTVVTVQAVLVSSIILNQTALNLTVASTPISLSPTVSPATATNNTLVWSSNNTSVATVSQAGVVSAVGIGSATITCSANDASGKSTTCAVTVTNVAPTAITFTSTALTINAGKISTVQASISPSTAPQGISWVSSNPTIASVDANGTITALQAGSAIITATSQANSTITNSIVVTVPNVDVTSISIANNLTSLTLGDTVSLNTAVYPTNATIKTVIWTSSDPSVATISSTGLVTALSIGMVTFTATSSTNVQIVKHLTISIAPKALNRIALDLTYNTADSLYPIAYTNPTISKTVTRNLYDKLNAVKYIQNKLDVGDVTITQSQIYKATSDLQSAINQVNGVIDAVAIETSEIILYPNPVVNELQVKGESVLSVQVFSLNGKSVITTSSNILDFSTLTSGKYEVLIKTKSGVSIQSVIKQ